MEMDEEIIHSPSGSFGSEQFYSPDFLWFKIFSSKFWTYICQRANTRGGRVL
jgi:hypothetical protein